METRKNIPPTGYMNELAKLCQCSRHTVRRALKENAKGNKCDLIRRMYEARYTNTKQ